MGSVIVLQTIWFSEVVLVVAIIKLKVHFIELLYHFDVHAPLVPRYGLDIYSGELGS